MAAPKPTMRRRKTPSPAALEFVEGGSKKDQQTEPRPKKTTARAPKKARQKPIIATSNGDEDEKRVAKRLYLPEDVERELRVRSATDGLQQSEIATVALRKYLGL